MKLLKPVRVVCFLSLLIGMGAPAIAGEEDIVLRAGPGRDLVTGRCAICHSLDYIETNSVAMTRARWEATLRKMIDRYGAPVSDEEAAAILTYLAEHYAPDGS